MYYNIKIITKDSELGLESNDKSIIEREMDLYFARIFGASEEFNSKIKSIKIDKPELKSINDIDKLAIANQTTTNNNVVLQEMPEVKTENVQIGAPEGKLEDTQVVENIESSIIKQETACAPHRVNESQLNDIFSSNQTQETLSKQETAEVLFNKEDIEIKPLDENKELEKEAQAMYEQLQAQVSSQNQQTNEINRNIENKNTKDEDHGVYKDIIDTYREKGIINKNTQESPVILDNLSETLIEETQNNTIEESVQDQNINIEVEDEKSTDETAQEDDNSKKPLNLSFSAFLSGFAVDDIYDELLICASYVKNVLRENDFTMKYINSKLFEATGKIADTSIIDELIKKEYIKTIVVDDFTKYVIAPKGEEYLASKLPG